MSNKETLWRQFNRKLISSFVSAGYQAIGGDRKTGLRAISGVCNYEFRNTSDTHRLKLWFGFSNVEKEPLRNIKMYEVLFSEKETVEQLLGKKNVNWDSETKKHLRCVEFGEVVLNVSGERRSYS